MADLVRASALGFQTGKQMAQPNPLGRFIRGMLEIHRERQVAQQEFGQEIQKIGIGEAFKAQFREPPKGKEQAQQWAWDEFQKGDRSPEVLRSLGMKPSDIEALFSIFSDKKETTPSKPSLWDKIFGKKETKPKTPKGLGGNRIPVRRKSDGATGTIEEQEFDSNIYERL